MILSKNKEIRISLELPVHDALDENKKLYEKSELHKDAIYV